MSGRGERQGNFGVAVFAAILAFATISLVVKVFTGADGLGLVWGVFAALIVVQLTRNSFYTGMITIFSCLFLLTVFGVLNLFV